MIQHKINNSTELMGYPDFVLNPAALDERYHDFRVVETEFLANQVRFHGFAVRKSLRMLAKDVDKRTWPLTFPPSTVNAFYLYPRNQILFPAGVLQPPLFSESQPMSLNFGHIGTFMGHEVSTPHSAMFTVPHFMDRLLSSSCTASTTPADCTGRRGRSCPGGRRTPRSHSWTRPRAS